MGYKRSMAYRAAFRCIAGCPDEHALNQAIYRCPRCGDLLEVVHDLDALKETAPEAWMRLFDDRYKRTVWPYGSSVWGKKEWVCPGLRDDNIVSMDEGGTNLFWAARFGRELGMEDLWVKLCGNSHTGSFKDLGMTVLVSVVRQMIADGATGSCGRLCLDRRYVGLAGRLRGGRRYSGHRAASRAGRCRPHNSSSRSPTARSCSRSTRDFDGCMAIVQRLADEEGIYLANSKNSLRLEGQKTVSIEIAQQLDWEVPDVVVIPGGNLGNVSALGAGFDMMETLGLTTKRPRIVVAQAEAANPLYLAYQNGWEFHPVTAKPTVASAIQIGNPVSVCKAIRTLKKYDGVVEQANRIRAG